MTIFNDPVKIIEDKNANASKIITEITTFKKLSSPYIPDEFTMEEETVSTNSNLYFAYYTDNRNNLNDYIKVPSRSTIMNLTSGSKTKEELKKEL